MRPDGAVQGGLSYHAASRNAGTVSNEAASDAKHKMLRSGKSSPEGFGKKLTGGLTTVPVVNRMDLAKISGFSRIESRTEMVILRETLSLTSGDARRHWQAKSTH
jgi:hypothetical protein